METDLFRQSTSLVMTIKLSTIMKEHAKKRHCIKNIKFEMDRSSIVKKERPKTQNLANISTTEPWFTRGTLSRVSPGRGKPWNLVRPFSRPWKVMETR